MSSVYPDGYIANLPQRIIETRGKILMSLMPSGVSGGGSDGWWDSKTTHETRWHWDGNRWEASATPEGFSVANDGSSRTVVVLFTVTVEKHLAGYTWHERNTCDICDATATGT